MNRARRSDRDRLKVRVRYDRALRISGLLGTVAGITLVALGAYSTATAVLVVTIPVQLVEYLVRGSGPMKLGFSKRKRSKDSQEDVHPPSSSPEVRNPDRDVNSVAVRPEERASVYDDQQLQKTSADGGAAARRITDPGMAAEHVSRLEESVALREADDQSSGHAGRGAHEVSVTSEVAVRRSADFPVLGQASGAARRPWYLPTISSQPSVSADQARLGDVEVRAASIVGPAHRCQEPAIPRQDAYRIGRDTRGEHLIVAVADGMSDSGRSDHGATVAASAAVALLRSRLDDGCLLGQLSAPELFVEVAGQITASAEERGLTPDEVRTGLIVGVIEAHRPTSARRSAWFGHVADVGAWIRETDGWRHLAGDKKELGPDRNSVQLFLPFYGKHAQDKRVWLDAGAVIALLTDGISDAFSEVSNAEAWFAARWATPPPLASFLLEVGFEAKGQMDDRTAVVVWCDRSTAVGP